MGKGFYLAILHLYSAVDLGTSEQHILHSWRSIWDGLGSEEEGWNPLPRSAQSGLSLHYRSEVIFNLISSIHQCLALNRHAMSIS